MKPNHSTSFFSPSLLEKVLWLFLCGLFVINVVYKCQLATSHQPDLAGFERNVIWGIQKVMNGEPLYTNPEGPPFAIVQYMPLFYYLIAGMGNLLNINPADSHHVYALARMFNFILCVCSALLLFFIARRIFRITPLVAFAVTVCGFLWMAPFSIAGRTDTLKTLLFQLLLTFLLLFPSLRKRYSFTVATCFAVLAFLTKQDGLAFCGLLPLTLLFMKDWRGFTIWSAVTAALCTTVLLALNQVFGYDVWLNVMGGLQNGISLSWLIGSFGSFFGLHALLFGLAIILSIEFFQSQSWHLKVLSAAWIIAFFPAFLFSFKYGSAPNYFMEAILVALLMFATWAKAINFNDFFVQKNSLMWLSFVVIGFLFYIPSIQWITATFLNREPEIKALYANQVEVSKFVRNELENSDSWVSIDLARPWQDHFTTLLYDRVAGPQRDVILQVQEADGKIDFTALHSALKSGSIRYFITDSGYRPRFPGSDSLAFSSLKTIGQYQVWRREN